MAITGFDNTYQKMMNHGDTQTLKSLILISSLERKRSCHFSTLIGKVSNLIPKWASNWCAWRLWDEKVSKDEVWKTWQKHVTTKHWYLSKKCPQKGSPKSDSFVVFRGSIPAWFLGRPWGGSQAQKHVKIEARTWIFCYFGTMLSLSLEDTLEYFVCSMNNKLIVLDVQFTVVFA